MRTKIKVNWELYKGTFAAPTNVYLKACFPNIATAISYMEQKQLIHHTDGIFHERAGYERFSGKHARTNYIIVNATSGRSNATIRNICNRHNKP